MNPQRLRKSSPENPRSLIGAAELGQMELRVSERLFMRTDRAPLKAAKTAERERQACLRRIGILNEGPDQRYTELVETVAQHFRVPMAFFSIIDGNRQVFRSSLGIAISESSRSHAFCRRTILGKGVFTVRDACKDPDFKDNPFVVSEPFIRFYAGAPVLIDGTHAIGALCLADHFPRAIEPDTARTLEHFSFILACMIETKHHQACALRGAALALCQKGGAK